MVYSDKQQDFCHKIQYLLWLNLHWAPTNQRSGLHINIFDRLLRYLSNICIQPRKSTSKHLPEIIHAVNSAQLTAHVK